MNWIWIIPQIKDWTIFQYPQRVTRIITAFWVIALIVSLAEYVLEWVRAIYATLYLPLHLPYIDLLEPSQNVLPTLLQAHAGLFVTLVLIRAFAFLTPRISLPQEGILFQSALGRRLVPYSALRGLRSVEVEGGRYVVWVDATKGLPLQNWLAGLLFGKFAWRGFMLTSDLQGFDQIVGTMVGVLKAKWGEQNFAAHYSEDKPTWLLRMLSAPRAVMHELATADEIQLTREDAARQMASAALSLALPLAVSAVIHLLALWAIIPVLLVPLFAMLEWPLGALYLSAAPLGEADRMDFEAGLRVYPITQLLRWPVAIVLALLVAAGFPIAIMVLVIFPSVVLNCWTVLLLTKEWFHIEYMEALLGIVVTLIFQVVLYTVVLAILALNLH